MGIIGDVSFLGGLRNSTDEVCVVSEEGRTMHILRKLGHALGRSLYVIRVTGLV